MTTPQIRATSAPDLSADPRRRMGEFTTMGVNARMQIFAALAAVGIEPDEADELVCSVEAGAVAGGHYAVEDEFGSAPDAQGGAYGQGWDGGVTGRPAPWSPSPTACTGSGDALTPRAR